MAKIITVITILLVHSIISMGQVYPHVKGEMEISIARGTIDCKMTVSNIPKVKDYLFLLNAGLNIRNIKNGSGYVFTYERMYIDTVSYESFCHYIPDNKRTGKYIPDTLQFEYAGKFPVVADTTNPFRTDWKGNIAFNGYSVRTDGYQCAWYPILYDAEKDISYESVTYDITIRCADCNTIYLNGSKPQFANTATFKSARPYELLLFAGKYETELVNGSYFLNPDISKPQMDEFSKMIKQYQTFFEERTGIAYTDNIVFVRSNPVSKGNAWMYVTYPTITTVGHGESGMLSFFDTATRDWFRPFMAHELGHYYFSHYKMFNTPIGDACNEGFSEYLSMIAVRHFYGKDLYSKKLDDKIDKIRKFNPIGLGNIRSENDYRDREYYVYSYMPILLLAIEKEIGEKKMAEWMRNMLTSKETITNYEFLKSTLVKVVGQSKTATLEAKYFLADNASNIIEQVK